MRGPRAVTTERDLLPEPMVTVTLTLDEARETALAFPAGGCDCQVCKTRRGVLGNVLAKLRAAIERAEREGGDDGE